jgi:hypothetical protein
MANSLLHYFPTPSEITQLSATSSDGVVEVMTRFSRQGDMFM